MLALPSFENLISLCAPLAREGTALRRDLEEVVDRRCIAAKKLGEENRAKVALNFSEFHVTLLCNIILRDFSLPSEFAPFSLSARLSLGFAHPGFGSRRFFCCGKLWEKNNNMPTSTLP